MACRGFKIIFAHALPEVQRIANNLSKQLLKPKPRMFRRLLNHPRPQGCERKTHDIKIS